MRFRQLLFLGLAALLAAAGCGKTAVVDGTRIAPGSLPRPGTIWVQPFAATPADLPHDSALATQYSQDHMNQTPEHVALGRKLGQQVATVLVKELNEMGMTARLGGAGTAPRINDIVIRGYLLSFDEGSTAKRFGIGLGAGASELRVAAEGLQVTDQGLRKLAYGSTKSASGKTPGAAVGAATFLATANPAGLILSTGMKVYGEASGKSTVEGRAEKTAKEIADVLKERFKHQGWL